MNVFKKSAVKLNDRRMSTINRSQFLRSPETSLNQNQQGADHLTFEGVYG